MSESQPTPNPEPPTPREVSWSLQNFGQLLKATEHLEFSALPLSVDFPADSRLARDLDKLRSGESRGRIPDPNRFRERVSVVAANDVGELMLSETVEQGNFFDVLPEHRGDIQKTLALPLPPGWRAVGLAQSHSISDAIYHEVFGRLASQQTRGFFHIDMMNFITLLNGNDRIRSYFVTTPRYTTVLVANKDTKELARQFLNRMNDYGDVSWDIKHYLRHPNEVSKLLSAIRRVRTNYSSRHDSPLIDDRLRKDLTDMGIVYYQYSRSKNDRPVLARFNQ